MSTKVERKEIRAYANHVMHTDVRPVEVVRKVSDKCVEVRRMFGDIDRENWAPEIMPGGFAGHCTNNREMKTIIIPQPENPVFKIRWSEAKGVWRDAGGSRYAMNDEPIYYYDYNF